MLNFIYPSTLVSSYILDGFHFHIKCYSFRRMCDEHWHPIVFPQNVSRLVNFAENTIMWYKHHVPVLNSVVVAVSAELCPGWHLAKQNWVFIKELTDGVCRRYFEHIVCVRMGPFAFVHTRVCTRIHTVHDARIWSWFKQHFRTNGFHTL